MFVRSHSTTIETQATEDSRSRLWAYVLSPLSLYPASHATFAHYPSSHYSQPTSCWMSLAMSASQISGLPVISPRRSLMPACEYLERNPLLNHKLWFLTTLPTPTNSLLLMNVGTLLFFLQYHQLQYEMPEVPQVAAPLALCRGSTTGGD